MYYSVLMAITYWICMEMSVAKVKPASDGNYLNYSDQMTIFLVA